MPRPRYRIADDDVDVVQRWMRERFRNEAWPDDGPSLTAWDRFPLARPTAKKLQRWCDQPGGRLIAAQSEAMIDRQDLIDVQR